MEKLIVSSSPHIKARNNTSAIMLDVVIALIPAMLTGIYYFGLRALAVIGTCVAASIISEYAYNKIAKKTQTIGDFSAVVTGVLLALNLPVKIPLWMAAVGAVFAIVVVKQLYGGIGKNFMNPALAARCFMLMAWAGSMAGDAFSVPHYWYGAEVTSSATPLAILKGTSEGTLPTLMEVFLGDQGGCIGETSGLALLIGFIYLLVKKVVDIKIPLAYIGSFAVLMYLFGENTTAGTQGYFTLMHICSGGLLLGALFMATDYVTTPTTFWGHIIFGLGCGILTFAIRKFGGYPDGVSFSIILMNVVTPLIDRFTKPRVFGEVRSHAK